MYRNVSRSFKRFLLGTKNMTIITFEGVKINCDSKTDTVKST